MRHAHGLIVATVALVGSALPAQTLADRVASAAQPRVQFTYAARVDVCGNGRSYMQVGRDNFYGNYYDSDRREPCTAGPIRVLLDRAGREVVSITTFAGPVPPVSEGVTSLGTVRTRDAAEYLLGLAERAEGRVSREAILPAVLADSVDVSPRLLAIAKNQNAPRETRSSAISWLGRPFDNRERAVQDVAAALVLIAKDEDDNQSVRQSALRTLARLEHGAGTNALMELARDVGRGWLAREALSSLNASGDPRARQHVREVVRRAELPDDVLASAIRGLGNNYANGEDIKVIRDAFPKFVGERSREAAVSAIATFGGSENVRWLLALAKDANQPVQTRRRAVQHALKGGTPLIEIVKFYDETTDVQLKDAVIASLMESGEKAGIDKLMQIARTDPSTQMRRKAINYLSKSSDERVKKFLSDLAER